MIREKESRSYMPKSQSDTHITPDRVFEIIEQTWGWTKDEVYDPCPVDFEVDGLDTSWGSRNYINPPYTLLKEFVKQAIYNRNWGMKSVMLLPAKTDQDWFHDLISLRFEMIWIRKRLKFKNNKWSATQPHFLVMVK